MNSVWIDPNKCDSSPGCQARLACPEGAIVRDDSGRWTILESKCEGCGACVYVCPARAIQIEEDRRGVIIT